MARKTALKEEKRIESLLLRDYEPDHFRTTQTKAPMLMSEGGRDDPEGLSHSERELEDAEPSALSVEEANSESEATSHVPFKDAHAEFSFYSPTLRLEPKPAWVKVPDQPNTPATNTVDPRRFGYRPQIPIRPFHKQRFYRRFFFYLRSWLSRIFRKTA